MGFIREELNLTLLNIGSSEHNGTWNWKSVCSPFARIFDVKEGGARIKLHDQWYTLKPNSVYLVPPFTLHDSECKGFYKQVYIHFYERSISGESVFDKYAFPVELAVTPLLSILIDRLLSLNPDRQLSHYDPKTYDNASTISEYMAMNKRMPAHIVVETKGVLLQLIAQFLEHSSEKKNKRDLRIVQVLQFIHENVGNSVATKELADIACVTEDHLIRLFKKDMKCTPLNYINSKKIECAQLELITSDRHVRDIALDLSIDNISYFNKLFKKYTQHTPCQYRKIYGGELS